MVENILAQQMPVFQKKAVSLQPERDYRFNNNRLC
jgi:hypothetical protein